MKKITLLLWLISSIVLSWNSFVQAQSRGSATVLDDSSSDPSLINLKKHVSALLQENRRLSTQYYSLQSRLSEIQTSIVIRKSEIEEASDAKTKENLDQKHLSAFELQEKIMNAQNELLVQQSRQALLSGQVLDGDEKLKLLKIKLTDLQFKQRQFDLDERVLKFVDDAGQMRDEREVLILKNQLEKKQEQVGVKEQQLEQLRGKVNEDQLNGVHKIEKMKKDNVLLRQQLNDLTKVIGLKKQQVAYLKDKMDYAQKSFIFERDQRVQESNDLKTKISALKEQYESIEKKLDVSLNQRQQKKQMMQNLIDSDKENQTLRDRIISLQDQINSLQK